MAVTPSGGTPQEIGLTPAQRRALPPFATMRAFEAVGTCGGIRRAAAALSVDHAAISRHLRALEQWAGVALIDRTPGAGGRLTEPGERFHRAIAEGLARIAGAGLELTSRTDDKRLAIWCAPGLASEWLTGRLGELGAAFPDLAIELTPTETLPDPQYHMVDAYVHYVSDHAPIEISPTLRSAQFARPPIVAVASRAYLDAAPPIGQPGDLLRARLIHEASFDHWRRWFGGNGIAAGEELAGQRLGQGHLTLAAARRGQGVALANALLVGDDLRRGELVKLGDWPPVYLGGYAFTARRDRWQDRAVMGFRRWLEKAARAEPDAAGGAQR